MYFRFRRWYQQPVKRRYVVASLAFLGFCCVYMLRVNLSVAIVAMTANRTHTEDNGTIAVVSTVTVWKKLKFTITQKYFVKSIYTSVY